MWPFMCVALLTASNSSNSSSAVDAPMQPIDMSALRPKTNEQSTAEPSMEVAVVGSLVVLFSIFGLLLAAWVQHMRRRIDVPV